MGGAANQPLVFTIPSRPKAGQTVYFVAQAANAARIEILVNRKRVKSCGDSVCLYQSQPFRGGEVTYAANAFDRAGNRTSSGWKRFTIQAPDRTGPSLTVRFRPTRTNQQVQFEAQARDPSGVAKIELRLNGRLVKTCNAATCSHRAGPFRKGSVDYEVIAFDRAGNRGTPARGRVVVTDPRPAGASTISGRISGQRRFCKKVAASNRDRPGQQHTGSVNDKGNYQILNLPDGRYRVYPLAGGKFDLVATPRSRDVICQGGRGGTANFNIEGISEG
jgi:hypothetical protein